MSRMTPTIRVAIVALVLASLSLAAVSPRRVLAHPMGNFTINHYSALTVGKDRVDVLYVVDMAEIPTYQELQTIREDRSTNLTTAENDAYTARKGAELMPNLWLNVNGQSAKLALLGKPVLSFPPGAGGLPTLRLELRLRAPIEGVQKGPIEYRDDNYKDRIGWKEIIAVPGPGVRFEQSSVPQTDLSDELRKYPPDLINIPPHITGASLVFSDATGAPATNSMPAGVTQSSDQMWGSLGWVTQQTGAMSNIMSQKDLPLGALLTALLIAFSVGAAHALSPGHGKTVVAAYLVGSRGTAWHAVLLGITVTISHTIGVFALGFIVLYLAKSILPEVIYPWLSFFSGMLLMIMGITLFVQRWRTWKRSQAEAKSIGVAGMQEHPYSAEVHSQNGHSHSHNEHADSQQTNEADADASGDLLPVPFLAMAGAALSSELDGFTAVSTLPVEVHTDGHSNGHTHAERHDHSHDTGHGHAHDGHTHSHDEALVPHKHGPFGRAHTHVPADGQRVTVWNLLVLGITGGILPCPSALVVLLVAVALGKIGLGMLLILAFSLGLAVVLTAIGLLMVYSRNLLNRFHIGGGKLQGVLLRLPMLSSVAVACLGLLIAFGAFTPR